MKKCLVPPPDIDIEYIHVITQPGGSRVEVSTPFLFFFFFFIFHLVVCRSPVRMHHGLPEI